jgi:hypothetical protein
MEPNPSSEANSSSAGEEYFRPETMQDFQLRMMCIFCLFYNVKSMAIVRIFSLFFSFRAMPNEPLKLEGQN